MKSLDFRDWMKIACDGKSTTLQHKKGHVMTIAHGALPKIQQEQLKRLKMAEGGPVDDVPEPDQKNAEAMQKGATQSGVQPKQWAQNLKEGLGLAEGGKVKGVHPSSDEEEPTGTSSAGVYARTANRMVSSDQKKFWKQSSLREHQKVLGEIRDQKNKDRLYLDKGTPDGMPETEQGDIAPQDASDSSMSPDHSTTININAAPAPTQASMAPPIPQPASPMANAPRYTGTGPGQGTEQIQVPEVPRAPGGGFQGVANQAQQAVGQQEQVDASAGAQRAQIEDSYLKAKQAQIDEQNQNIQQVRNATQRLDAYTQANGINPNAWWENKSTPHKVANMIGLVLGGFQGGFNGTGNNPALNQLMMQQERDIQAQKDRMEQQKTVYGAYHQLYGDNVIASNLAAVSWNDLMKHQVDQMAARLATPQAAASANKTGAVLNQDSVLKLGVVGQRMSAIKNGQIAPSGGAQMSGSPGKASPMASAKSSGKNASNKSSGTGLDYVPTTMLSPDAEAKYNRLAVTPILTPEQKSTLNDQYNKVKVADQSLAELPHVFHDLANQATASGMIQRKLTPSMSGAIGEALGPVIGIGGTVLGGATSLAQDAIKGTDTIGTNRKYDSNKTRLYEIINRATGGNASSDDINRIVNDNAPEKGDLERPDVYQTKMKTIESFIKKFTPHGALDAQHWTKKQ